MSDQKFKPLSVIWFLLKWYITISLFVMFPIPTIIAAVIIIIQIAIREQKKQKPQEQQ